MARRVLTIPNEDREKLAKSISLYGGLQAAKDVTKLATGTLKSIAQSGRGTAASIAAVKPYIQTLEAAPVTAA